MKELIQILAQLKRLLNSGESFALATVVFVEGSAYRRPGARMLIDENGNWWGGISGGCLEGDLLKKAQLAMRQQTIKNITYDTREDDPFQLGIGLGCQGLIEIIIDPIKEHIEQVAEQLKFCLESGLSHTLQSTWDGSNFVIKAVADLPGSFTRDGNKQVFVEQIPAKMRIWIVGNQFDAISLILICQQLAWEIHWVGNKLKMNSTVRETVHACYDWQDPLPFCESDCLVLMTHDFDRDVSFLKNQYMANKWSYVGILGPNKRMDRILKQIPTLQVNLLSSPIGLDIGAEGPDEIAISIVSEILAIKNGRNGQSLKHKKESIHS
jgi:xanthine/CO dehydrogenase XdhC/CoxF family maturation factor